MRNPLRLHLLSLQHLSRRFHRPASATPDLSRVHALVTGASSGIGLVTARRLAALSARCTLVSRRAERLESILASGPFSDSTPHGGPHAFVAGDVAEAGFWEGLTGREDLRGVNVLVSAAGVAHTSLLVRTGEGTVEEVVRTNLMGVIWGTRWAARQMIRGRRDGVDACIVNVTSLLGLKGGRGSSVYAASKAGVVGEFR